MKRLRSKQHPFEQQVGDGNAGYTLIEMLVVVFVIGVLAAIAAPGWHEFNLNRRLSAAEDGLFQALRQAQTEAIRSHFTWQFSLREQANTVQWAIHPASTTPTTWQDLIAEVHIDPDATTLSQQGTIYRLQFNEYGRINGQLGRVTIKTQDSDRLSRCIFASTLLGTLRRAADQACQ